MEVSEDDGKDLPSTAASVSPTSASLTTSLAATGTPSLTLHTMSLAATPISTFLNTSFASPQSKKHNKYSLEDMEKLRSEIRQLQEKRIATMMNDLAEMQHERNTALGEVKILTQTLKGGCCKGSLSLALFLRLSLSLSPFLMGITSRRLHPH
jgi:chorismate synthase